MGGEDERVLTSLAERLAAQERELVALRARLATMEPASTASPHPPHPGGMNRRAMMRRIGAVAAGLAAVKMADGAQIVAASGATSDPNPPPPGRLTTGSPVIIGQDNFPTAATDLTSVGTADAFLQRRVFMADNFVGSASALPQPPANLRSAVFASTADDGVAANAKIGTFSRATTGTGVWAESGTGGGTGVYGKSSGTGPTSVGVAGVSSGIYGVTGVSNTPGGCGVRGDCTGGIGVLGNVSDGYGVLGQAVTGNGLNGFSQQNHAIVGQTARAYFGGVTGVATIASTVGIYGTTNGGGGNNANAFAGYMDGNFVVANGVKSAAVKHADGSHRLVYCMESPENWFEDFGEAKLVGGRADVKLDADFAAVVDSGAYHVFLTPKGESKGLYLSAQTAGGFSVREQQGGASSVAFSYRVVAKRGDIKAERLAKFDLVGKAKHDAAPRIPPLPQQS
jgi:hypothetical protein